MTINYAELADAIVKGEQQTATTLVQQAVDEAKAAGKDETVNAKEVLNLGLIGGMDIISDLWAQEKIFIPEVLISARVMHGCMGILRPILEASNEPPRGDRGHRDGQRRFARYRPEYRDHDVEGEWFRSPQHRTEFFS